MKQFKPEYYRYLPHFQPKDGTFFVTARLHHSLPKEVLERLKEEKQQAYRHILATSTSEEERKIAIRNLHKRHFANWDKYLDQNQNDPQWLKQPEIAQIVVEALHFWDKKSYELVCYTLMPNHFHLVIDTYEYPKPLYRIMHSLKSYTAKLANKLLNRTGAFWQEESYDHVVRNGQELYNINKYILDNPVKAGLINNWEDYPFSYLNPKYLE
ncbi:transposase [Runella sp. MFBS21]|uniref:transposase n=1 Tax=Runella sp. MFBS21 TaxID=3034018 RepID=UPI0023F972FC|nr:transposase [Runella sp. MFBS21]MDF7819177.1 transposase [Runella sp. MFBS21]